MAKYTYVHVLIIIAIFIAIILVLQGLNISSNAVSVSSSIPYVRLGNASTLVTSTEANVSYNTTTSVKPPSCSSLPGYECVQTSCTPINSTFMCGNVTYAYSPINGTTYMWATVGQNTGTYWSGFGAAFVPNGTMMSQGTPQGIRFNVADSQSTSNVGTNMTDGGNATVKIDNGMSGTGYGLSVNGTVWVCYTNSGILYVGNGCLTGGRVPATYVEIGRIG
jgi:hypothetical protein